MSNDVTSNAESEECESKTIVVFFAIIVALTVTVAITVITVARKFPGCSRHRRSKSNYPRTEVPLCEAIMTNPHSDLETYRNEVVPFVAGEDDAYFPQSQVGLENRFCHKCVEAESYSVDNNQPCDIPDLETDGIEVVPLDACFSQVDHENISHHSARCVEAYRCLLTESQKDLILLAERLPSLELISELRGPQEGPECMADFPCSQDYHDPRSDSHGSWSFSVHDCNCLSDDLATPQFLLGDSLNTSNEDDNEHVSNEFPVPERISPAETRFRPVRNNFRNKTNPVAIGSSVDLCSFERTMRRDVLGPIVLSSDQVDSQPGEESLCDSKHRMIQFNAVKHLYRKTMESSFAVMRNLEKGAFLKESRLF